MKVGVSAATGIRLSSGGRTADRHQSGRQQADALICAGSSTQVGMERCQDRGSCMIQSMSEAEATIRSNRKEGKLSLHLTENVKMKGSVWIREIVSDESNKSGDSLKELGVSQMSRSPSLVPCPLFSYIRDQGLLIWRPDLMSQVNARENKTALTCRINVYAQPTEPVDPID